MLDIPNKVSKPTELVHTTSTMEVTSITFVDEHEAKDPGESQQRRQARGALEPGYALGPVLVLLD